MVKETATFCYPAETSMIMSTFRDMMENPLPDDAIAYLSEQDNNLRKSFPELLQDIEASLPLADEAFGCQPEATNIWIGDERSVSSLHKGISGMYLVCI
jgi:jumonji domain-containing protein 7